MELQQSPLYIAYIRQLGWKVVRVDGVHVFIRHIPFLGGLAKIQRSSTLPSIKKLVSVLSRHRVKTVAIEPASSVSQEDFTSWYRKLSHHVKLNSSPFLPTKTILIGLSASLDTVFARFTSAKRRAVRKAQKNNVIVKESSSIDELIRIKNKSAGFLGFITTHGMKQLWPVFGPSHAAILLAYETKHKWGGRKQQSRLIGGVLLLFWEEIAYYWLVGATTRGKKLFAPTLLIWESLKLSRGRGMKQFDFIGVWDERLPKKYDSWKGFTKFKEGFGGTTLYYPIVSG